MKITPKTRRHSLAVIFAVVFGLTSTTLTVSAQTEPGPADPAPDEAEIDYPADTRVCSGEGWTDVDNDSDLARACLAAVGVNSGTAVYAFARPVDGYDPDNPMGGGPEEAGLVSRWAMAEALYRSIDAAVENPMPEPSAAARSYFTDVGWLSEGTRNKIAVLYDLEVTKGTSQEGIYDPAGTVTRGQMALFFVRTLRAVEQLYPLPEFGPPDGVYDKFADIWEQRISEIRSAITSGRWDCTAASFPAREQLGVPFVDVCGWENDSERVPAVWLIYDLGVTVGFPADDANRRYYRAAEPVTGGQMAKFLVRLLAHTELPGWHPRQQPPEENDLPEVQQDGSQRQLGDRRPDGSYLSSEESRRGLRSYNEPLPAPAATRPPREIDIYRYATFESNVWDLNVRLKLSEPFSLQIGDWYWNKPPHTEDDNRTRYVLMELRTAVGYRQSKPITIAFFCRIPEAGAGPEDNPERTRYKWRLEHVLPDGPGLFRQTDFGAEEQVREDAGFCNLADYDIPEPAGGYTERYPCEGSWPARVRKAWGETWDNRLLPCQP